MSAIAIIWNNEFNAGISYVTIEKSDYPVYFYGQIISLSDVAHVWCSERDASYFFISFSLLSFFWQYRNIALYATFLSQHTRRYWSPLGTPGKKDTIDNPRSSVTLSTRSGTPSGVSLREEKERAVTYQELIHAEGTSERRESAGSGGPQGIAGYTRERKREEKSGRRGRRVNAQTGGWKSCSGAYCARRWPPMTADAKIIYHPAALLSTLYRTESSGVRGA